jgi:hypothetical protein
MLGEHDMQALRTLCQPFQPWKRRAALSIILLSSLTLFTYSLAFAQNYHSHDHHAGMSMAADEPLDPAAQAKLLADKQESEFNHHLAGFFLILAGLFILAQVTFLNRFGAVRYAWPACFLLSGLFLLVFSDTELWPFGPQSWIHGLSTQPEVLQHKTFAAILLALGVIEAARARERLKAAWAAWVFPVCAIAGSILLLFHHHDAGMHGPDHMALMERIQSQHLSYSLTGFGIGISKGLSEIRSRWQNIFSKVWPALMIVLGVLLMFYAE